VVAEHAVESFWGQFGSRIWMRLADAFLLQDGQLDQRAGHLQLHSCVAAARHALLHTPTSTTSFRIAYSRSSRGIPLYNAAKRECLPIATSSSSHRTASSFSTPSNPTTLAANRAKEAKSGSTW
jgi:hypothetical protein